jgi:peptidoglycan/LPS O-acetylase OafA/YrhL
MKPSAGSVAAVPASEVRPKEGAGGEGGAAGRVLGWDFLRGLCALSVAVYHLLYWQDLAYLHTFGSYGVHLFFVLSGASLAYTYAGRFAQGRFAFGEFLFVRWWRLAPLYIALMLFVLPQLGLWQGPLSRLAYVVLLNASFLFGLDHAALLAILTGGWSLGIEFLFYLAFPLFMRALKPWRLAWAVLAALAVAQAVWVSRTVGATVPTVIGLDYYGVAGFAAYFFGGCMLGAWQRSGRPGEPPWLASLARPAVGLSVLALGFALMGALNPGRQGQELLGWRGLLLPVLCLALVAVAGAVALQGRGERAAQRLGDATYGVYLIHPVLFFYVVPMLGLQSLKTGGTPGRLALAATLLALSFVLALLSERFFEQPLRHWSKSRWAAWRARRARAQ